MPSNSGQRSILFLWENFGPTHVDRCDAVARHFGLNAKIIGVELYKTSSFYSWNPETGKYFEKKTIFKKNVKWISVIKFFLIAHALMKIKNRVLFLCHYERLEIFLVAVFFRILGNNVYMMNDSKLDDKPRYAWREFVKTLWFAPYHGALAPEGRSVKYLEFHGFDKTSIASPYDAIDTDRIRKASEAPMAPAGEPFRNRYFTIIARLVPEKNIQMAIEAYSRYLKEAKTPRKLYICGDGPMKNDIVSQIKRLNLEDNVILTGFLQSPDISKILSKTLAVILPSRVEPFGFVISEAQAMGLPVVVTTSVGAIESLVINARNGFIVEPDNPQGLAWYLLMLCSDKKLWVEMCKAAQEASEKSDAKHFAIAVECLLNIGNKIS